MKLLIDAQLPRRLARTLTEAGHDAIHTLDLVDRNRTADSVIGELADHEDRVVVSKDSDFRDSHLLRGTPRRLLEVATGNTSNTDLRRTCRRSCLSSTSQTTSSSPGLR